MQAEFCTQVDVGEGSIGGNLDGMVTQRTEWSGKVRVVGFKVVELWNVHQEISLYVFVLWGPNPFAAFVDNSVLVRVVIGGGAWRGSEEVGEKVRFWEDREAEDATRGSRRGRRRDDSDRGGNDRQREVFYWDIRKWDTLDYFLKLLVDVGILGLWVRVFKLRTREVVLLGGNIGEYFKEVGQGSDKDRGGGGDRDDGRQINDEWGKKGGWADRGVREDGDSEWGRHVAVGTWIIPSVVGAIEEILNNLVGGGNVDLINVINL